ncbi:Crp/Fnr family transcriptional regulator [Methylobacterium sp. A49B]
MGGATRFSQAEQHALRDLPATIWTVEAQRDIVNEGDPATQCCLVLDGWICCYHLLTEAGRQILSFHVPGDLPDLQCLHLPRPDFGIAAVTRATVAFVPHAKLRELANGFPTIAAALWRETLTCAAIHRAWITSLGRRDARQRLAHLICELYLRLEAVGLADEHILPMPLRQPDLADALGLTSVHMNRTLKAMRTDGLISLRSRRLEIRDWAGLSAVAEFDPQYLHLSL